MPLKRPLVYRAGNFAEMHSSEHVSQQLLLSAAAFGAVGGVFRSFCDLNASAASLGNGSLYFVYLGRAQCDLIATSVAVYAQSASGLGTDSTRIGFAVGSVQPDAGVAQSFTIRSVSTISMASTGRKAAALANVQIASGEYVWAYLRHAVSGFLLPVMAQVLPLMGAYNGEICSISNSAVPTVGAVMDANPVPYGTAQAPDLTLDVELQ